MAKFYTKKLIKSGHVYEVYEYEKPVRCGDSKNPNGRRLKADDENSRVTRQKTLNKAKQNIRRLINANVWQYGEPPIFLTLTFAENVTDTKQANYEFKKFRQRLEYMLNIKLKYVAVVEFQKRGAIHYHIVFFNLPYVPVEKLSEVWSNGFIKVNKIDHVDNVGAYLTKYIGKEFQDDRLRGQKCYFTSRGLVKWEEITDKKKIEQIESTLGTEIYKVNYINDYVGSVNYKQYNIKRL